MPFREIARSTKTPPKKKRYRFDCRINGKRFRDQGDFNPRTVADDYARWYENLARIHKGIPTRRLFETFERYLEEYVRYRKSPMQYSVERSFFRNRMQSAFEDLYVESMRRKHIDQYINWRRSHQQRGGESSNSTINKDINILSAFFKWCIHQEIYTLPNPCSGQRFREMNERHIRLSVQNAKELLQKARTFGEPFYLAVVLGVMCGLRRREIVSLKWSDIDFNTRYIELRSETTKSKKHRSIPLSDSVYKLLLKQDRNREFVVPLGYDGIRYRFNKLRTQLSFNNSLSVKHLTFHDTRHIFAQALRDLGVSLGDVQSFMGHSSVVTTERRYAQAGGYNGHEKVNHLSVFLEEDSDACNISGLH